MRLSDEEQRAHLVESHTPEAVRERLQGRNRADSSVKDFIYGSIDGIVTTFAIVAGVVGAKLSDSIILALGLANLIADGFSMAASNFLGTRAESQGRRQARREEEDHIRLHPEGEREEVRQIFAEKGFQGEDLETIVSTITKNTDRWVDTMMAEEHGYSKSEPSAWRAALVTFFAFITVGSLPLISFYLSFLIPSFPVDAFLLSGILTATAFVLVGALKGKYTPGHWAWSALETLAVGSVAAGIAYFVGAFVHGLTG